jgi:predicted AlkP superfamily pyrophosphatase or phosphodiesterase
LTKTVVFFYIDALNHRLVNPKTMPFLSGFANGNFQMLENVFGYSYAIQSSMLSGRFPDETNSWLPCFYSPESSPRLFKMAGSFAPFSLFDKVPKIRNLAFHQTRRFILKKGVHSDNIPFSLINKMAIYPYYYMCELPYYRELQVLTAKRGIDFTYIGPPTIRDQIYTPLLNFAESSLKNNKLILAYEDKLDFLGHAFGPNSKEYISYAKGLDKILSKVYKRLKNDFGNDVSCLFFSDHGQCETTFAVDLIAEFEQRNLKLGKDYICFVDATLAFVWCPKETVKEKILTILKSAKFKQIGTLITENLRQKYHISFNDNRYGNIVFALKPGGTFFPNFFSPFSTMKGLHGYLPEDDVQRAFVIADLDFLKDFHHVKDFHNFALNLPHT